MQPASSTAMRKWPSGEASRRDRLVEASKGKVMVCDFTRSVAAIRLPIAERRVELSDTTTFPPRYGPPRRFWKRKFMAAAIKDSS